MVSVAVNRQHERWHDARANFCAITERVRFYPARMTHLLSARHATR
ncbi:hypothetical protein OKW45_005995 [Paraburkholderia sp. WSM4175]